MAIGSPFAFTTHPMRDLRAARVRGRLLRPGSVSGHVPLVLADPNAVPHHRSPQRRGTAPPRAHSSSERPRCKVIAADA